LLIAPPETIMNKTLLIATLCASTLAATLPAHAVDGEILITQAKALAGNVTPGDAPGFPVTISLPGKYKLAGNLSIAGVDTNGIEITSPRVTLDLNGFAIQGPVTATTNGSGANLTCSGMSSTWNTGVGVLVHLPAHTPAAVTISNGTVAGMGGTGVMGVESSSGLRQHMTVDNLRVSGNGRDGIVSAVEVRNTVAEYNCGDGMFFVPAVRDSTARYNAGWGINTAGVLHVRAYGNGDGAMVATSAIE
jgi:hypothetical protein